MNWLYLLFVVGFAASYHVNSDFIDDHGWHLWKSMHNKAYKDLGEERVRYVIWQDNLKRIEHHNSQGRSFTLRMNHFGDLTLNEFSGMMNGLFRSNRTRGSTFLRPSNVVLPTQVDWRKQGYVTDVKNQGQCGSCWSFSATGSLEGQHFKKTGKLVSLSEQNLVDCSGTQGNQGCNGGLMDQAFQYVIDNQGIDTEDSYPYEAQDGQCRFDRANVGATCTGFVDVSPSESESALQEAVATVGPVSVAIDASQFSFQFYSSGVYDEQGCSQTALDHGVLAVGYGTDNGQDYWLVKNSWGAGWGMQGYIEMSRNKNNQCGIATQASYPLV